MNDKSANLNVIVYDLKQEMSKAINQLHIL